MTEAQARRVGRLISRARQAKGLSMRRLAGLSDTKLTWLINLESGRYATPDPARLSRLAEVLDIAPDRLDRLTRGHVSANLPGVRTYLRTKYDLNPDQIAEVEAIVQRLQRQAENGHDPARPTEAA